MNWNDDFDVKCKLQPLESKHNCELGSTIDCAHNINYSHPPGLLSSPFSVKLPYRFVKKDALNIMECFLVCVRNCLKPFT